MEREDEERRLRREMRRIKRKKEERIRQLILAGLFTAASVIILAAVVVLFKNLFQKKQVDPGEVQVPEYRREAMVMPARPAIRPLKLYTVNLTFAVLMPENLAAVSLPPTA